MTKHIFVVFALLQFLGVSAMAAMDPATIKVKIYGVAVSASLACDNPIVIFDSANGIETDFLKKPVLGGGNVPDGTYPCVMINMSDNVKFTPAASDGVNCVAGTEYTIDICRSDNGCSYNLRTGSSYGSLTAATGTSGSPSPNVVTMYLRTNAVGTNNFQYPANAADTSRGLPLASAFVVSGSSAARFVVDARGQVASAGGQCGLNAPTFAFR